MDQEEMPLVTIVQHAKLYFNAHISIKSSSVTSLSHWGRPLVCIKFSEQL